MTTIIRSHSWRGGKNPTPWDNLEVRKKISPRINLSKSMKLKPFPVNCWLPNVKKLPDFCNTDIYKYDNYVGKFLFCPHKHINYKLGNPVILIFFPLNVFCVIYSRAYSSQEWTNAFLITPPSSHWWGGEKIGGLERVGKIWSICWEICKRAPTRNE